jgi:hypothetical protein
VTKIGLLLILVILSGGLVNALLSFSSVSISSSIVQFAFAANTINNQTSTSNVDCDATSSCNTSPSQTASVSGGNGNTIVQELSQVNDHCLEQTICNDLGEQSQRIAESTSAEIIDEGQNNHNVQINVNGIESNNDNSGSQHTREENHDCQNEAFCSNEVLIFDFDTGNIGSSTATSIENDANSNNNTNIQNNVNIKSNNENTMLHTSGLKNDKCEDHVICRNLVVHDSKTGFTESSTIRF